MFRTPGWKEAKYLFDSELITLLLKFGAIFPSFAEKSKTEGKPAGK